jgi:hypothetical protein
MLHTWAYDTYLAEEKREGLGWWRGSWDAARTARTVRLASLL